MISVFIYEKREQCPFTTRTGHEKVEGVYCVSEARGLWFGWIKNDNGGLSFWGGNSTKQVLGFNFDEPSEVRQTFGGG